MKRSEAIAAISTKLASFDDERVFTVAEIVAEMDEQAATLTRRLTDRELQLIEQSREDFRTGRTYSIDEARALSDAFIAGLGLKYPSAP